MGHVIACRELSKSIRKSLADKARKNLMRPGLAVILVGDDLASQVYVRNKQKACEEVGFFSTVHHMSVQDVSTDGVICLVKQYASRADIHGILVQLPLPRHIDEQAVLRAIDPDKDVDGFHAMNAGRLMNGELGFVACTPKGVMRLLEVCGVELDGKNAVVAGRSNIVGKPMALLLLQKNCTVTIAHSHTKDLAAVTRSADILVVAVGRAGFITGDMIKPGAAVMDVGINRVDGKVVGDVDFESAKEVASCITPVPGGVGAMTIAMLMENTVEAAENYARRT